MTTMTLMYCPYCATSLTAIAREENAYDCRTCGAMVDVLDEDLTMISMPPDQLDVSFIPTVELQLRRVLVSAHAR